VSIAYCGIATFHALQEKPLRIPFAWSALFACINIFYAGRLYKERFVWLSDEERAIFEDHFQTAMEEPDFQQLIQSGKITTAEERVEVIQKGVAAKLVLLVDGAAEVSVGEGVVVGVHRPGLLGESSYLRGTAATKTVSVLPGCRYVLWDRSVLKGLFEAKPSIQRGLELMIGRELSRKLGETSSLLIQAASDIKDQQETAKHHKNTAYERVVLHYTLRLLASEPLFNASHCQRFFDVLSKYREQERISDEVHHRAMEQLGIDETSCIRGELSLRDICMQMTRSPIPHSREVEVEAIRRSLPRKNTMLTTAGV